MPARMHRPRKVDYQGKVAGEGMRITLSIVGCLLIVLGCIWVLQGINVLPGNFMTGQILWVVHPRP